MVLEADGRQGPLRDVKARRLVVVDVARGWAISGVVLYHLVWDLAFLGITGPDLAANPIWIVFGRTLAGSFLFLAGFSLVLANRHRVGGEKYFRRLFKIVAAAAAITLVTWIAFPNAFVFFGILHAIAFGTIVGYFLLRARPWVTATFGFLVLLAPRLFRSTVFDNRWVAWIGFSETPPASNDFVPVFPWIGIFLLGIALARAINVDSLGANAKRSAGANAAAPMAWLGRRSLAIYLIHQPVLLAILFPLA